MALNLSYLRLTPGLCRGKAAKGEGAMSTRNESERRKPTLEEMDGFLKVLLLSRGEGVSLNENGIRNVAAIREELKRKRPMSAGPSVMTGDVEEFTRNWLGWDYLTFKANGGMLVQFIRSIGVEVVDETNARSEKEG